MTDTTQATAADSTAAGLQAQNQLVVMTKQKFGFKKADPITNIKRAPVDLMLPAPTINGLIDFLQNPDEKIAAKNQQFVLDLLFGAVIDQARQQVSDDDKPVNKQEELDMSKLDITYIANLPAAERRAGGIAKEVWDAFGTLYSKVMPGLTSKPQANVDNAVTLLVKRLIPCKTRKDVLATLKTQLDIFYAGIPEEQQEEFADIYQFLSKKADDYLTSDEMIKVMDNL